MSYASKDIIQTHQISYWKLYLFTFKSPGVGHSPFKSIPPTRKKKKKKKNPAYKIDNLWLKPVLYKQ